MPIDIDDGLIGPRPCQECGGSYGEHERFCSIYAARTAPARLTDAEKAFLRQTGELWNAYLKMPHEDLPFGYNDAEDVKDALHVIQRVVATRVARRADPDVWK